MKAPDEFDWKDEEREALSALNRDMEPDWRLEERTVARLKKEGLIRDPVAEESSWWKRLLPRRPSVHLAWASAATAVVVAVFFAGVALGEHWATRSTADALAEFHEDALMQVSARVQKTGSAYVAALAALAQLAADGEPQKVSQGREAALAALYAAASQLVDLDPDDPVATRILQGLYEMRTARAAAAGKDAERQVMWF